MLQLRGGLYNNRDARFSPLMSPLGGGRDAMSPLARLGQGLPYDLMSRGGYQGGILGGRGSLGRDLLSSPRHGSRTATSRDFRDPLLGHALQRRRYSRDIDPRLGLNALLRYRDRDDSWPHGSDCDTCWRERRYHEDRGHHDHGCACRRSCGEASNSNSKKHFDFKTKDVTIRGKARAVRASYLAEASKFEGDFVKFMEKKKEEDVPDRVVDMLISFINREQYMNDNVLDEVTLNIVASNIGAKSAGDYSLAQLKKCDYDIHPIDLCHIIKLVTQSSKVDDGLKKWLVKYLETDDRILYLEISEPFRRLEDTRPEVVADLQRMLGIRRDANDGFRNL